MDAARTVLNVTTDTQRRLTEWMERLSRKRVTEDDALVVREALFGSLDEETPTRRRDAIERWTSIYNAEKEREGRTGYTLLQTVTGFADHIIVPRSRYSGEEKFHSALGGRILSFKRKGIASISAVSEIAAPPGLLTG
jgi:hypothetical protein